MTEEFLTDVKTLREKARENIDKGPVTDAYGADLERVIFVLNQSLATELVCVLRYKRHFYTAEGLNAQAAAQEFLEHAGEEAEHADMIASRIQQLGGKPDFNPNTLTRRSHSEYDSSEDLKEMIREWRFQRIQKSSLGSVMAIQQPGGCLNRSWPWKRNTPRTCWTFFPLMMTNSSRLPSPKQLHGFPTRPPSIAWLRRRDPFS
jgi:bacterioferritin (cytochrome b1)